MEILKRYLFFIFLHSFLINAHKIPTNLKPHDTIETLDTIKTIISKKQKGAYLRFGNGEIDTAASSNYQQFDQTSNIHLQKEMQEALALNGPTILKGFQFGIKDFGTHGLWEPGMCEGNHEHGADLCLKWMDIAQQYWNAPITDIYSPVAPHFALTHHTEYFIEFMKFLKQSNCTLFIGNQKLPANLISLFFGNHCTFIPTKDKEAYDDIDIIESQCKTILSRTNNYQVVIGALGISAEPLFKRLWYTHDNVFLLDFGSAIDALCGIVARDWIKICAQQETLSALKLRNIYRNLLN